MFLLQSKHQHGANYGTDYFFILSYQFTDLLRPYFGTNTATIAACNRRFFLQELLQLIDIVAFVALETSPSSSNINHPESTALKEATTVTTGSSRRGNN